MIILDEVARLYRALISSASRETAYDPEKYDKSQCPLIGHCGAVAYVVQKEFGGAILSGRVLGESHFWNRLPNGDEVDLTAIQFGQQDWSPLVKGRVVPERKTINPRFIKYYEQVKIRIGQKS